MIDFAYIEIEEDDYYETDLSEMEGTNFTLLPENLTLHVLDNYFPECLISRRGNILEITIEEHIYTKYWFHKYHASVFAEAMVKAIKRLSIEGLPFSNIEIEDEDDVHIFIRWILSEPATIDSDKLKTDIQIVFDAVYSRANSMLDNSDSVLILGKDTGEGLLLLKRIQNHLENLGFYTYIIKEQPDKPGESIIQKVMRYGLSSRFVIVENTESSGHLYEIPHIAKLAELTCVILQEEGKGATWMFEDLYHRQKNISKVEYTDNNLETQIEVGISWANDYNKSFTEYQKQKLPWFKDK